MKTQNRIRVCFCLLLSLILYQGIAAAADRSIENFVSQREQWKKLLGVTQTLEGRLSTFSSKSLRFRNCPIPFYFAGPIPKLDSTFKNVEVTGELARENGRIIFRVQSLKKMPTDVEYFVTEETKIDRSKPREWYTLADWAKKRAAFYDDKELTQKALTAYQNGIDLEYRQLLVKQPKLLLKLADRAQEFQLDPQLVNAFKHEALVLEWQELQKQKKPDLGPFITHLLEYFPTAKTPQKQDMPAERKQYLENQTEVFNQADQKKRERLVRWFYSQILLEGILKNLSEGGSNGFEIAARIEKQLPERMDLVKQYQNMQLDFDFNRVGELARQYVLDLSQEYQKRGNPKKAKQTLINWLQQRRKKLDAGDADGRVRLARDLIELTSDQPAATKLLLEAWKLNPKSAETAALLGRLGFMLQKDKWLNPEEVKEFRDDPIRKAIRNGTVIAGMNRSQVKKALGAPTQIGRSISGGAINELWIYGEASNQSLIIQLARKQNADEFKVIRIKNAQRAQSPIQEANPATSVE
ncbi:tetratricopeptide repeat protein [Gimesia fumaroli]|uniref:Tetratricopeptide repeat protein n=1 Tax=Gimesia fumaroli TaxID=2527976 RepID=A0A518I726_9PLAN|nr:hypothetical protein [Gimesia fumaroli]QDV48896.1 hypothetical protein Enr17x_09110 [Gimesia fumaroli]